MKAAVVRAFGEPLSIEEVVLSRPSVQEVRVRIAAVAVCGSDLHANAGSWGGRLPTINGHEAAGVVAEFGEDVSTLNLGDRVVVSLLRSCGTCFFCAAGERHLCSGSFALDSQSRLTDASGVPIRQGIYVGGFAEEVIVHVSQCVVVPAAVPLDRACLLACGVITGHGAVVNTARVPAGASVVVLGLGGVGMHCLQGAKAAAAFPIIGIDTSPAKLDLATRMGATHSIRAEAGDLERQIGSLTAGRGADYVFVAVGVSDVVELGLQLLRRGGTLVVVGIGAEGAHIEIDASEFASSGRTVIGSNMGSTDLQIDVPHLAQRYLAGDLRLDEMISQRFSFDEINRAIAASASGENLRNVIVFEGVAP